MASDQVRVRRATDGSKVRYAGLIKCELPWVCPVCSVAIGEQRQKRLEAMNVAHVKAGGMTYLMTLTFPHEADTPLPELLEPMNKARQAWTNSRVWKRVRTEAGALGAAMSFEITHGINGWHPHLHMLLFVEKPLTDGQRDQLRDQWIHQLMRVGLGKTDQLDDMLKHAMDIRGGADAAAYIAKYGREEKWGISSELSRSHAKTGQGAESVTPFGLLALYESGEAWAGVKFREFADAMKGKRLMTFTRGLVKLVEQRYGIDLDELETATDDDAPEMEDVGVITPDQWSIVLSRNARGALADFIAMYCLNPERAQEDINDFVDYLRTKPQTHSSWFGFYKDRGSYRGDIYLH